MTSFGFLLLCHNDCQWYAEAKKTVLNLNLEGSNLLKSLEWFPVSIFSFESLVPEPKSSQSIVMVPEQSYKMT